MSVQEDQVLGGVDGPAAAGRRWAPAAPAPDRAPPQPVRRLDPPLVVVSSRGGRPLGVLVAGPDGPRWQRTVDAEGLLRLALVAAGAVGVVTAARRPVTRVDRLSMGPGGWVSFKAFPVPRARWARRPRWARLLRAHRAS